MARSITFVVDGPVDTQLIITEQVDGTLRFDLEVLGSGLLGDLRGLFLDLKNLDSSTAALSVMGIEGSENIISQTVFAEEAVSRVEGDVNVKGEVTKDLDLFDAGIEFGTEGIGSDDVSSASFILSSGTQALSLDSLDLTDLALRYTSVGVENDRDASAKIAGMTSGVARNDAFEVDENTQDTTDLLANDTNGTQSDGTRKTVISVQDTIGFLPAILGGFERTVVIDGLELGTLTISNDGYTTFVADGTDVDKLGHDAIRTYGFTYETQSNTGNLTTADVVLTIDGQNDQPVAIDLFGDVGEDDAGVTIAFEASDIDIGDTLSYRIETVPTDAFGHQYGEVVNNNDGTFTFNPLDNFQFLEAGESRDVTFQYVAIDDSGVGTSPISPEETDTSDPKTVTITVDGSYDAPIEIVTPVLFESVDQSMWETGPATIINYRDFFGVSWDESFDQTLVSAKTITIVPEVDLRVAGVGPYYGGLKASTPEVAISGGTAGRFGISPYFEFNSGDVDSSIPVDVDLTYEVQYEDGDNVSIATGYTLDNAAYFDTESPSITFGLDLVFEATANGALSIGSSNYNLFPNININVDEAEPIPGVAGSGDGATANLLEFSSITGINSDVFDTPAFEEDGEYSFDIPKENDDSSLVLSFPYIETVGAPVNNSRLESTGSDDVAVLTLDVDDLLSQTKYFPPVRFTGDEGLPHLVVDLPGFVNDFLGIGDVDVDLFSINWDLELFDLDLIGTLTAVQDFILDIDELPLLLTLENGFEIDGYSLGDTIDFVVPDLDLDNIGDMDGELDYTLDIDMEAIFNNWTTLDFSLDLFAGILKATGGWTSDIVGDQSFNLFGDASDPFLYSDTFNLLNVSPLATLFGDENPAVSGFDIEGWNTPSYVNEFNIA